MLSASSPALRLCVQCMWIAKASPPVFVPRSDVSSEDIEAQQTEYDKADTPTHAFREIDSPQEHGEYPQTNSSRFWILVTEAIHVMGAHRDSIDESQLGPLCDEPTICHRDSRL